MRTRRWILAAFMGWSSLAAPFAWADQDGYPLLKDFFQEEIGRFGSDQCSLEGESDWPLKRIFFGIEPYVSIGLKSVLNLTVAPEIVFVWEKVDHD